MGVVREALRLGMWGPARDWPPEAWYWLSARLLLAYLWTSYLWFALRRWSRRIGHPLGLRALLLRWPPRFCLHCTSAHATVLLLSSTAALVSPLLLQLALLAVVGFLDPIGEQALQQWPQQPAAEAPAGPEEQQAGGLAPAVLASLPRLAYSLPRDAGALGGPCPVCMLEPEEGAWLIRLPCSHWLHAASCSFWFSLSSACPVCMAIVQLPSPAYPP